MSITAAQYSVPTREEVSPANQAIFDKLEKQVGFVPNLYAYYAKNDTALSDYLALNGRRSSLKNKEKEAINLVTSQVNGCDYCLAAHTTIGKMNGLNDAQILEIREGSASFDPKLDALVRFTYSTVNNRGRADENAIGAFFAAGYTEANLIDVVMMIGDKTISNYIHNLTGFEIDFPKAPQL